jgi:thiamine pyrophosphate-dependent acetolactate synthase large subunit-like protein
MILLYQALANAFVAEGVDLHFTLMGDGNMHWASDMAGRCGVRTIHARHEHSACAMATAYAKATGKVGIVSVTMGPGFAQTTAALTTAARARLPIVMFAGDTPTNCRWALQQFDQAPVVNATGARHVQMRSAERALADVREAFWFARTEQRPVVITAPIDLQRGTLPPGHPYIPSTADLPRPHTSSPAALELDELARRIDGATWPIFIAGRGAIDAGIDIAALASQTGALLSTTLPARGLFDHEAFSLGIAGGFATDGAREQFALCDLVVAFGSSLGHHTADGGKLFQKAHVVQVDPTPQGYRQGVSVASTHLAGDAGETARALLGRVKAKVAARSSETARRIAVSRLDRYEFPADPNTVDPRALMQEIDEVVPKDWTVIASTGHSFYFSAALMRGRSPRRFHSILDFGAIGSNLAYAIAIAAEQRDGKVLLFDGDGSFLMQIQELETIKRHRLRLLACLFNDGAYGAELHKLRAEGIDATETVFGRPPLAAIAQGFGLRAETVTAPGSLQRLFEAHIGAGEAEIWDIHVSQNVVSPYYRHEHWRHGTIAAG